MLNDIPYRVLKEDKREFEIMTLRDQGKTFTEIGEKYHITPIRVNQLYHKIKLRQVRLYIWHISLALGYKNIETIRTVFYEARECYQDISYACAYLEKKYQQILDEYRAGEPGMPKKFLKSLPPFKRKLSESTIARIIEMREKEKATFRAIGKELRITPEKAKYTYDYFYHQQVCEYVEALANEVESEGEKRAIRNRYFKTYRSAKKCYDQIMAEKGRKNSEG